MSASLPLSAPLTQYFLPKSYFHFVYFLNEITFWNAYLDSYKYLQIRVIVRVSFIHSYSSSQLLAN